MSEQNRTMTAYCGLYCGDCIRYRSRASELAVDLYNTLKTANWDKYAVVKSQSQDATTELAQYKQFEEVLKAIINLRCDNTCRQTGGCKTFQCEIVACCLEKRYEGCWQCTESEKCPKFASLQPFHGDTPQKNLTAIREYGLDSWVEYRNKFYIWQSWQTA